MKKIFSILFKFLVGVLVLLGIALAILYTPDISAEELNEKYEFADSQWIEIDGTQIHYRKVGQGRPLVLVHGFAGNLRNWEGWTEILKDSFTVISYDLPGYGLTGATQKKDYSDTQQVKYLKSLTTALGVDSFALAGNSMGGGISWKYALQYPSDVTDLILVDAGGYRGKSKKKKEDKTPIGFKLLKYPALKSIMAKITPSSIIRKSLENTYSTPGFVTDEEVAIVRDLMRRPGSREVLFSRMNSKWSEESDNIKNISIRTLILWGDEDHIIPVENAARFEEDIENAEVIIYDKIGHLPMHEIPARTARDVRSWMTAG